VQISHAANRRTHGLWQSAIPSRFISELPVAAIEVKEGASSGFQQRGAFAENRWSTGDFSSTYDSPGWRRAQSNAQSGGFRQRGPVIEVTAQVINSADDTHGGFSVGDNVVHAKFGAGRVIHADGNKLTVRFQTVGEKKVVAAFLQHA